MCFGAISASLSFSLFSILAADAKEKQFWVTQLRACAKHHMETNSKVSDHGEGRRPLSHLFLGEDIFLVIFEVSYCGRIHACPGASKFKHWPTEWDILPGGL
jgi:hypothetical protein